jgi:Uncharacterized protein conserved in bacteria (DUF2188)
MHASTHIEPDRTGGWIVRHEDDRELLSEHSSATEAERAARERAELERAPGIVVHDRYARLHPLSIEAGNRTRTRRAR